MQMLSNKKEITNLILNYGIQKDCTKLSLQNIVFPKWSELGLLGMVFRQCVSTKEQPSGHIYDEAQFQTVIRIIGGKVLISERPDCYCWKFDKVQNADDVRVIGTNSAEGLLSLCEVLDGITDAKEKNLVADMFTTILKQDLLLVTTPAEKRRCIEVTSDLFIHGITYCVDEWMETDENGNAPVTFLEVGDYLIVTDNGVYRIGKEEFLQTHTLS